MTEHQSQYQNWMFAGAYDDFVTVSGNYKPWERQLQQLGGTFHRYFRGAARWVFPSKDRQKIEKFVDDANRGRIDTNYNPIPKTITPFLQVSNTVDFPNMFIADDGLTYQIIMSPVPIPYVGQRITLVSNNKQSDYIVGEIKSKDEMIIKLISSKAPNSRAIIMNGKWQIHCLPDAHELIFHK